VSSPAAAQLWLIRATVRIMGAAEGSIMATIMTNHMTIIRPHCATLQGAAMAIHMPDISSGMSSSPLVSMRSICQARKPV